MTGATARERFREAGRRVLRQPGESSAHAERVRAAIDMDGSEPVQGALADMLSACRQDVAGLLAEPAIGARLGPYVLEQLQAACSDTRPMGPVSTLATRWSVLVSPSMDMPRRALLSGVDDARAAAATAVAGILAGDDEMEREFLAHCVATHDSLAFMLARRALMKAGHPLGTGWDKAMDAIGQGAMA